MYKQLNQEERLKIYVWLREWQSRRGIAIKLDRNVSTISRELKRNKPYHKSYDPLYANRKSKKRFSEGNSKPNKVWYNGLKNIVEDKLKVDRWSPDTISWRLWKEQWIKISTQTIYNYIYRENLERKKYLKYKKWYRRRWVVETRWSVKPFRSIEERPKSVENRNRFGHWEIDTVWWKKPWWWGLLTITERKSRYCEVERLDTRRSLEVKIKTLLSMKKYDKKKLLTITRDNGKEFALFTELESDLDIKCYAAHAYASYERWTNEHANWMIRVFYPKWTDFTKISDHEVCKMKEKLNNKPRKILNYRTPYEVLFQRRIRFF